MHYHYFRRRTLQQLAIYIWVVTVLAFVLLLRSGHLD